MVCLLMQVMSLGITAFASEAPTVVSVTPQGEAVTRAEVAKVTFSTNMDRSTLTTENITVTDVTTETVVTPTATSAYDTAFVFTADFESDKEYKITVSTAVKSAEGVALASAYEHTFTTGTVVPVSNIAAGATWSRNTKVPSVSGSLEKLYDGNKDVTSGGSFYQYGDSVNPRYARADLGKARDLSHVIFYTTNDTETGGVKIQASNDANFASNVVDLAIAPSVSGEGKKTRTWIATADEDYQYIQVITTYMAEIEIYAYVTPEVKSVTPSGDNVTKADVAKITFDMAMDRSTLTTENITITNVTDNASVTPTAFSAYDNSVAFTADFESNKEYKVTVSADVKAASGISLAEGYEHTFTTGEVMKATNIASEATYTRRSGGSFSGADTKLSCLTDGAKNYSNSGTVWYNYGLETGVANWAQANFDSEKNIAYVVYYPYKDGNPKGAKFLASVDGTNWDELASIPALSTHPGNGSWIAVVENDKAYKYIRMQTTYIDELEIFSYVTPEVTNMTPGIFGSEATDVRETAVGKISFNTTMDRGTLNDTNIVVTDENGNVMKQTGGAWNANAKQAPAAYDRSYVFACDFEPDTTYTVTVSANVKSIAGVPLSEEVVHKFTTGHVIYPARDVTPRTYTAYTVSEATNQESSSTEKALKRLFDYAVGNKTSKSDAWFLYGGSTDKWVMADLGEPRRLAYVSVMADYWETSGDGDSYNDAYGKDNSNNVTIEVANSSDFSDAVTLAVTPNWERVDNDHPQTFWTAISDESTAEYQYIRIRRAGVLYVDEIEIFSYDAIDSVDTVTSGSYTVKDFAIHGTFTNSFDVTLSADVASTDAEAKVPMLVLALYRATDGIDTLVKYAVSDETELGNLNATITNLPELSGCYLKGFLWDGTDLVPLTRALTNVK